MPINQLADPNDYHEQRIREGSFRCVRCGDIWPLSMATEQDGLRPLCKMVCYYESGGKLDTQIELAEAQAAAATDPYTPLPYPIIRPEPAVNAVTGFSPATVNLAIGSGIGTTITLTGVGFSTADVISYSSTNIVDAAAPVVNSSTQITLSVRATVTASPGTYRVKFNGSTINGLSLNAR